MDVGRYGERYWIAALFNNGQSCAQKVAALRILQFIDQPYHLHDQRWIESLYD